MTTNAMKLYESLYDEFGRDATNRMRRELTIKNGTMPSYIELYAALALQAGPPKQEVERCT